MIALESKPDVVVPSVNEIMGALVIKLQHGIDKISVMQIQQMSGDNTNYSSKYIKIQLN